MNTSDIGLKLLVWLLIVVLIGLFRLRKPRHVPTILTYLVVVVSALMLGRYIGIAEIMMQIRFLHF